MADYRERSLLARCRRIRRKRINTRLGSILQITTFPFSFFRGSASLLPLQIVEWISFESLRMSPFQDIRVFARRSEKSAFRFPANIALFPEQAVEWFADETRNPMNRDEWLKQSGCSYFRRFEGNVVARIGEVERRWLSRPENHQPERYFIQRFISTAPLNISTRILMSGNANGSPELKMSSISSRRFLFLHVFFSSQTRPE